MAANDVVSAKDMFQPCDVEEETHDETMISMSIPEIDDEHEDWVYERRRYIKRSVPLYNSCLKGDWKEAKRIIDEDPNIIRASITHGCQKPLHVAAGAGHVLFVEQLMKYLTEEDLLSKDAKGNTAFCFAVAVGSVPIAKLMIRKNPQLPQIRGGEGMTTLYMATLFGHEEMAWFLYPKLIEDIDVGDRLGIFFSCIHNDLYEIALKMLHDYRELAVARDMNGETAVHLLARKPSIFSIKRPGIWKCFVQSLVGGTNNRKYLGTPGIRLLKFLWETVVWQHDWMVLDVIRRPSHALFIATKMGNFEFVAELLHSYPDLIWETDEKHRSVFHIAVMFHDTRFFNLLNQLGVYKDFIVSFKDDENNNILHLAAKLAPPNQLGAVPGPAFQMQRELLWFQGVKRTLQPSYLEMKNAEDKTPKDLFTEEHKGLMVKGESWMKSLASSCMLASTLIAISVFASLTGVIDDRTTHNGGGGTQTTPPAVCVLSNIFALFYSSLGIIIFVSILSSRFAEDDFLVSLPLKLIVGLGSLYISTIAMMVSFGTTLYTTYHHRLNWLPVLVFILASLLLSCLYRLHCPLVSYVLRTTYYSWVRLPTTHNL